jgi:phage-related protein
VERRLKAPPKLQVRFFRTDAGNEPVREWLKDLPADDRKILGDDLLTMQYGWPIGMPLTRALGHGLHEVRSTLTGNRIARVIFVVQTDNAILLHGFVKKTQTTSKPDLELARERSKRLRSST